LPPGLLTNDTLILALMRHHAVTALAGHDADFDRVAAITRFRPACALEAPRRAPGFSASGCWEACCKDCPLGFQRAALDAVGDAVDQSAGAADGEEN
jgi:hypothetical protein